PIEGDRAQGVRRRELESLVDRDDVRSNALSPTHVDGGDVVLQVRHAIVMERVGRGLAAQEVGAPRAAARIDAVAGEVRAQHVIPGAQNPRGAVGVAARVELVREVLGWVQRARWRITWGSAVLARDGDEA